MFTGIETPKKKLSTIVTVTGSATIIALAIAFVAVDYNGIVSNLLFQNEPSSIISLEPSRSDPVSEPSDTPSDNDGSPIPDDGHENPCFDPDCPICNNSDKPPIDIETDKLRFKSDEAVYIDEAAANAALSEYVSSFNTYFENYPDGKIYLVGTIAKTYSWSITDTELSQQRADTVRQSFIDMGVDGDKLIAIGIGINDPWRTDEWVDGVFDTNIGQINRRVWVIPDAYTEQVDAIMDVQDMIEQAKAAE